MKPLAIISQYFYPNPISTSQLLTDLSLGLAQKGHKVHIFTSTPKSTATPLPPKNLTIYRSLSPLPQGHSILSKALASLFFILSGLAYVLFRLPKTTPLLIASNPPYAGLLGMCFKLFRGGQYTFLFQDIFPESAVLSGVFKPHSLLYYFFNRLMALICHQAQHTIVLTPAMQAHLQKKHPTLNQHTHLTVIENWAIEAIRPIPKTQNPFAQQYGLDRTFTVLYSGNIGRLHDIETIAQAIVLLQDQPIQFVFIGNGPKQPILTEYLEKYQLQNLLLLPFQPRSQLTNTLTACDISLVSLIPGAETTVAPCKLYGMLAAGRAILSIAQPGSYVDGLLRDAECGLNCPPGKPQQLAQTIQNLSQNLPLVERMGTNAHQRYQKHYTFQRALAQYQQLLNTSN
jgi:glycosyltransferase involved in cell wall biosynthesis